MGIKTHGNHLKHKAALCNKNGIVAVFSCIVWNTPQSRSRCTLLSNEYFDLRDYILCES